MNTCTQANISKLCKRVLTTTMYLPQSLTRTRLCSIQYTSVGHVGLCLGRTNCAMRTTLEGVGFCVAAVPFGRKASHMAICLDLETWDVVAQHICVT